MARTELLDRFPRERPWLLPALQAVQRAERWLSPEALDAVAAHLRVPRTDWMLQPILAVVPLQLLAYRIARLRDLNVDQPRNLAKTVTVE